MAEFTTDQRKQLVIKNEALPDGSYPIRNAADLKNAIQAYGRAANKPKVMAWIKKRAKELNLEDSLPEGWKDAAAQSALDDETYLSHHGILGQKWGVRRTEAQLGNKSSSMDAKASAKAAKKEAAETEKADKKWAKSENIKTLASSSLMKTTESKEYADAAAKVTKKLDKAGLVGSARDQAFQSSAASIINDLWSSDKSTYSPSGTSRMVMTEVNVYGQMYLTPQVVSVSSSVEHAAMGGEEDEEDPDFGFYTLLESGSFKSFSASEVNKVLAHYGILGQKWGVRRTEAQLGNSSSGKKTASDDYTNARAMQKRGTKNLSTKELKELTTRLQLEQQYKNLNPSEVKKGMNVVKAITAAGTTVASLYALSKTPLAQDVIKAVSKKAG